MKNIKYKITSKIDEKGKVYYTLEKLVPYKTFFGKDSIKTIPFTVYTGGLKYAKFEPFSGHNAPLPNKYFRFYNKKDISKAVSKDKKISNFKSKTEYLT